MIRRFKVRVSEPPLPPEEYVIAAPTAEEALIEARADYIRKNRLDPVSALPEATSEDIEV